MTPLDLLETARSSIDLPRKPPGEADCRRAVSTAYYALFHCLARDCANLLIGDDPSPRGEDAWRRVYRALEHGPARERCKNESRMKAFPARIQGFARTFATLQDERHNADYDPLAKPSLAEAQHGILVATEAILDIQAAPEADRRAFCAYVLFRDRR